MNWKTALNPFYDLVEKAIAEHPRLARVPGLDPSFTVDRDGWTMRDVLRVIRREVSAGLLLGILLGTIAFFRALLWGVDYDLAACVAMMGGVGRHAGP